MIAGQVFVDCVNTDSSETCFLISSVRVKLDCTGSRTLRPGGLGRDDLARRPVCELVEDLRVGN